MPCELYISGDAKYSFFVLRSSICSGMIRDFGDALVKIIKEKEIKSVTVLTSTMSPVKRERESNRDFPEIFAYVTNSLDKQTLALEN